VILSNTINNTQGGFAGRSEIEENVIQAIRSGQVKMRPRWHFLLKSVVGFLGIVAIFFVILAMVSLAVFALQANGGVLSASLGPIGIHTFFTLFPWALLALAVILIAVLGAMLDHFTVAYQQPFLYLMLTLLIVVALASVAIAETSIGNHIISYLPPSLY